jgi:DNA-binding beta-propeller fold protein YncE
MRVIRLFALALAGLLNTTCVASIEVLVSSYGTGEILRYDANNGSFLGVFAAHATLERPVGITIGPDNNLYVADEGDPNGKIVRFDGTTGALIDTFVTTGSGGLVAAHDIVFGPDGNLYVSSQNTHNVLRYDGNTGAFIDDFVTSQSGGLWQSLGISFGPDGHLYVADGFNDRVNRYDGASGNFIDSVVSGGALNYPEDVFFDSNGDLLVSSRDTNQILKYNLAGNPLGVFASGGGLSGPVGMLTTPDNEMLVSGIFGSHIIRYDASSGALIDTLVSSGLGGLDRPSMMLLRNIVPEPGSFVIAIGLMACFSISIRRCQRGATG